MLQINIIYSGTFLDTLDGKNILLGVTGGIASYKTPQLVRELRRCGAEVQVVMTAGAKQFVTATSLQAVSGRVVRTTLWDETAEAAMGHIELARWADLILAAPATAHLMARLAQGLADDLLTTLWLATTAEKYLAPAMNHQMWSSPPTQRNYTTLCADGVKFLGPAIGPQACGEFGPGRMVEPEELASLLVTPGILSGRKLVVTAGPTREALDPVRYLSNHSSGKQGYAVARAAQLAGADVTLISGPVNIQAPPRVRLVNVTTALEMKDAVIENLPGCDVFIGVAAVADYRPEVMAKEKIKKLNADDSSLPLVQTPDIIALVANTQPRPFVVGFAAETNDVLKHGREKRKRKKLDMIVVNDVSDATIGFGGDNNAVTILWDNAELEISTTSKTQIASRLIDQVAELLAKSA